MKFTDFDIEHFFRFPEEWSTEKAKAIKGYIEQHPHAKELAEYYRELYMEINTLKRAPIYELRPASETISNGGQVVLAADSTNGKHSGLKTIMTFNSEDGHQVLRVLENQAHNTVEIHLISNVSRDNEFVIVQFSGFENEFILNDSGMLKGIHPEVFHTIDWNQAVPNLRFPTAIFEIDPSVENESLEKDAIRVTRNEGELVVTSADAHSRVLMVQHNQPTLYFLADGKVKIQPEGASTVTIFFYQ
ncbi:MAG: hypothetical protein JJ966_15575 [Balneolaceae bacterium]|nr:hypothetical protein [Balneolaceae bacterium]